MLSLIFGKFNKCAIQAYEKILLLDCRGALYEFLRC